MPEIADVVHELQRLGMSGYEAKAYVALVSAGRALNGYEVAKRSGVPRSTVYEALGKLVGRGAAFEAHSSADTTAYIPLPPSALLRRLRAEFESSLAELAAALPTVSATSQTHVSHHIEGRAAVLARAVDLISAAAGDLHVSAWSEDLAVLTPALAQAAARGVDVAVIRFGPPGPEVDAGLMTFDHLFASPQVVFERVGCRLLLVATDRSEVLIGATVAESTWASYSDDPAVVLLAVEFIRHDVGFQVLAERIGVTEVEAIFDGDPALRRIERGRGAPGLARRNGRAGAGDPSSWQLSNPRRSDGLSDGPTGRATSR